ncbi:MvdC/MvdD family ATP grasp protein [Spirillospora sp. NPDC127200]
MVLIVTARDDFTADLIVKQLREQRPDVAVARLDPSDDTYPLHMDVRLEGSRWSGCVSQGPTVVDLDQVGAILWRWVWSPLGHPEVPDELAREWAAKEDQAALFGTLKSLPAFWVNHPDAAARAVPKPVQLCVARDLGLSVPHTAITTAGNKAAEWADALGLAQRTLHKAFNCQGIIEGGMIPAGRIDLTTLPDDLFAASMFQSLVEGDHVRLTVIGDRMFAAAIRGTERIDWRPEQKEATYVPLGVPDEVQKQVREFMDHFDLAYGAFDFVVDRGDWVFLECNPTGQYGFIEFNAGLPLTEAFAKMLADEAHRHSGGSEAVEPGEGSTRAVTGMAG